MNGRTEKELKSEKKAINKLQNYPTVITDFYYYLEDCGKSYTTASAYINYIIGFVLFYANKPIWEDFYKNVTPSDINRYMSHIKTKKDGNGNIVEVSEGIRAARWSALNQFFEYLKNQNYIAENPVSKTKRPRDTTEHTVTYLTKDEIAAMLQKVKDEAKPEFVNRDLCLLSLAIVTGLSVSVISNINISDINFEDDTISVFEKKHTSRKISFGENTKKLLQDWIEDRNWYFDDLDTNALFITQHRRRISIDMVRRIVLKYTDGITAKHITPQKLRASCAVAVYEETRDIRAVADILGNTDIQTTARYARASEDSKDDAVKLLDSLV